MFCVLYHIFILFMCPEFFHYVKISNSLDVKPNLPRTLRGRDRFICEISSVRFNLWINSQLLSLTDLSFIDIFFCHAASAFTSLLTQWNDFNDPACVSISKGSQNWILFFDFSFMFLPNKRRNSPQKNRNPKRKRDSRKSALLNLPQILEPLLCNGLIRFVLSKGDCPLYEAQEFLFTTHQTR